MKNALYFPVKAIAALALTLTTPQVAATTYSAETASFADVSQTVARATTGDTVLVPPGSVGWTNTLLVTNGITLRGAGTNATVITCTNGAAIRFRLAATSPLRITEMAFVATRANNVVLIDGSGYGGAVITSFRVDHCQFTEGLRAVCPRGWAYGVIDHCTFVNCNIAAGPIGDNNSAWERPIEPGSTNAVYIEDNLFVINNQASAGPNEQIYHQTGARSVTRFNMFDGTASTTYDSLFFDSHGNWCSSAPQSPYGPKALDYRGQPLLEIYGNTFSAHHSYRFGNLRGGSLIIYSNAYSYITGPKPAQSFTEEEGWSTAFWSPLRTNWPAVDQITNTFHWANTLNGTPIAIIYCPYASDTNLIQQNRDYWMEPPNAANGNPAGVYKDYKPLAYPHPRVAADDGDRSSAPSPPTNLLTVP